MPGPGVLEGHVRILNTALEARGKEGLAAALGPLALLPGGAGVTFPFLSSPGGASVEVQVAFAEPSAYPKTPLKLSCNDPEVSTTLEILADGSSARLPKLLEDLCDLYGVESDDFFQAVAQDCADTEGADGSEGEGGSDGEDEEYDEGQGEDMAEAEDRSITIACAQRQNRWERFEEQLSRRRQPKAVLSMEEGLAESRQIFAPQEAFQMLSKELLDFIRKGATGEISVAADAVGDSVYEWSVIFTGFDPDSQLAKDLAEVKEQHGYDSVEVRMTFLRGLHPFYPPKVELVRPRMPLALACALSSHPMLSLELWDPCKSCADLINDVKKFLQNNARVDTDALLNSPQQFPDSAYAPLERQLLALEAVSPVRALAASQGEFASMYSDHESAADDERRVALGPSTKKQKAEGDKPKKKYWAAGTGYGTSDASQYKEVWDMSKTQAAQAARDQQLEALMSNLRVSLRCHLIDNHKTEAGPSQTSETDDGWAQELSQALEASSPYRTLLPSSQVVKDIGQSCLIPLLIREISLASFSDMSARCGYYTTCLRLVQQLACPMAAELLCIPVARVADDGHPVEVRHGMKGLQEQAQSFLKVVNSGAKKAAGKSAPFKAYNACTSAAAGTEGPSAEDATVALAELIMSVFNDIVVALAAIGQSENGSRGEADPGKGGTAAAGPSNSAEDSAARYCREIKAHQVECSSYKIEFRRHHFQSDAKGETVQPQTRVIRLGREIAALKTMLPLHESSSILVRVDEEMSMLWRVMITGPEDTPYSLGCFIFDVYFPSGYPGVAPMVNLQTTGGGVVRFNPNLYNDGKVCLSLLGTWDGHKSETWDPQVSTIVQVLVSIQSLILVPQPYFNEPGYERGMGEADTERKSEAYNREIREATVNLAILGQLQKPPKEFEDAIKAHYRLQKDKFVKQCEQWIEEATNGRFWSHQQKLTKLFEKITPLLEKL